MESKLNHLHHAQLLVGEPEEAEAHLESLLSEAGLNWAQSPDCLISRHTKFQVEDARTLSEFAGRKAFGAEKVMLVVVESINFQAQNALLKTFEEPIPNTYFFLSIRDSGLLLPTLLSRMEVTHLKGVKEIGPKSEVVKFLALPLKGRIAFAKRFVDAEKNLSIFLDELLLLLKKEKKGLKEVYQMRLLSDQSGGAPRLILEYLALVL